MFNTSFQKKTLYASITGLFLGLILLGCPFFVSAGTNEYFNISSAGMVDIPSSYCEDDLLQNTGSIFNVYPEWISGQRWGSNSVDPCVGEMSRNMEYNNAGDGDYWFYLIRLGEQPPNRFYSIYHREGGVWSEGLGCSSESCGSCTTSENCLSAGCIYEYNEGFARWECHQEYVPIYLYCVDGFSDNCYACHTQETCEALLPEGLCEWVDKGYGEDCYPTEEAPPEAVWEEPELENCEELSGVEKWLCEIKNWLAGLFMPTQEKINDLNLTIKLFKTKFPFNYANSLTAFFTTIKTGLDTNRDIPIKIFGQEGNVDFDILNAEGSIGGQPETLKNIFYDITTALVIFGFLLWLISFIRRIF